MVAVLKFLLHTVHNNIWRISSPVYFDSQKNKNKLVTKIVIIHHILEFGGELKGIFLHVLYGDCNQGRCC